MPLLPIARGLSSNSTLTSINLKGFFLTYIHCFSQFKIENMDIQEAKVIASALATNTTLINMISYKGVFKWSLLFMDYLLFT